MINSLTRINELAKKQRNVGLTQSEQSEQQLLRSHYLQEIRGQVMGTMNNLKVVDPIGNDVTPDKLKQLQQRAQ